MKIKLNGTILESSNDLVVTQWKKKGYKEFKEKAPKLPINGEAELPQVEPEKK